MPCAASLPELSVLSPPHPLFVITFVKCGFVLLWLCSDVICPCKWSVSYGFVVSNCAKCQTFGATTERKQNTTAQTRHSNQSCVNSDTPRFISFALYCTKISSMRKSATMQLKTIRRLRDTPIYDAGSKRHGKSNTESNHCARTPTRALTYGKMRNSLALRSL